MNRSTRMLLLALVLPIISVGLPYWERPYAELQLPGALLWWPLVMVFFGALAAHLAGAGFRASWGIGGAPLAIVVAVRVVRDVAADPTSHNLWPLELLIAAVLGWGAALLGAAAAARSLRARSAAAAAAANAAADRAAGAAEAAAADPDPDADRDAR